MRDDFATSSKIQLLLRPLGDFGQQTVGLLFLLALSSASYAEEDSDSERGQERAQPSSWFQNHGNDEVCNDTDLEAKEQTVFCLGGEFYGAFHRVVVEDKSEGSNRSRTDYQVQPILKVSFPESWGWQISAKFEWLADKTTREVTNAYITLSSEVGALSAGKLEIGGVDQGNEFMTSLGEDIIGEYGNLASEQSYISIGIAPLEDIYFSLAYALSTSDVTEVAELNNAQVDHVNAVLEWDWEPLVLGVEYEHFDHDSDAHQSGNGDESNRKLSREYAYGIGVSYQLSERYRPFLNYGVSSLIDEDYLNNKVDSFELNIGLDVVLNSSWGMSLGYELLEDDRRFDGNAKSDDIQNGYFGLRYVWRNAHLGAAFWYSDQKASQDNDNISQQIDVELGFVF